MDIKVTDVMMPSEAQKNSNIHGSVSIEILADDGSTVVRLSGISVRKTKDGTRFLAMPSFPVGKGDQAKYLNHYSIFPGKGDDSDLSKKQRARMDKLTADVMRILDAGGTKRKETAPKPAAATGTKKEPWDA